MISPEKSLLALGDKNRLLLLRLVLERPMSVGDLTRQANLGQSLVSHHLAVLAQNGWVIGQRRGRQRIYSPAVSGGALSTLARWVKQQVPLPEGWQAPQSIDREATSRTSQELEDYLL
jgi:DNA-binding transcriptional ArsR family regulator